MPAATAPGAPGPGGLRLLLVGHSHLRCIRDAAQAASARLAAQGLQLRLLMLNEPRHRAGGEGAPGELHPRLQAELREAAAQADAIYLSVGGNAPAAFGLIEHPLPWDFCCEAEPGLPLLTGRTVIPGTLLAAAFAATPMRAEERALRRSLADHLAACLAEPPPGQRPGPGTGLRPCPLAHLESPPPPLRPRLPREHAGASSGAAPRAAPPSLRRKLWRLHSMQVREECAALGLGFVPVPAASLDAGGHLVAAALGPDPTHANEWYGRRVIEQLAARHGLDLSFPQDGPGSARSRRATPVAAEAEADDADVPAAAPGTGASATTSKTVAVAAAAAETAATAVRAPLRTRPGRLGALRPSPPGA